MKLLEMTTFEEIVSAASDDIGITLSTRAMDLLSSYYEELLFWNDKMSLVSIKSSLDIPKHVIDSLTVLKFIPSHNSTLLDIGTGAGFPGIPLKVTMDSLFVALLDSSRKKTSFLKYVIRKLKLKDISVIHDRAESLIHEKRFTGGFDVVISKAAFKISQLLLMGEPFLSSGGILIAMKGDHADEELAMAADTIKKTGLTLKDYDEITLPVTGETRIILCFHRNMS
ncbi:MAG TPA: 16S rRNA (guanine(527)-N(7))-methyltransferase RsmG [Syntrophales bacterium]|nr:16S rRNA (guanine(527)-N(7))-methyltransferase RsmG [Syntrophales bacterium]